MASRTGISPAAPPSRRATRHSAPNSDTIDIEIATLEGLGVDALRQAWRDRFKSLPPPIQSADILRRLIAWKIQAEAYGGLDVESRAHLAKAHSNIENGRPAIAAANPALRPGSVLVREWRGTLHRVLVLDSDFEYAGKRFGSLSEIARAISGTRWSGPRFFGIEDKTRKPRRHAAGISA
jgi:hypothetical protein